MNTRSILSLFGLENDKFDVDNEIKEIKEHLDSQISTTVTLHER
jgi:hypothetical protein